MPRRSLGHDREQLGDNADRHLLRSVRSQIETDGPEYPITTVRSSHVGIELGQHALRPRSRAEHADVWHPEREKASQPCRIMCQ